MTQPPYRSDPDRPQDTPRSFPTYGRPDRPHTQQSGAPQQTGTQWAPPGQPQPPQQAQQPGYGQSPYRQPSYGQSPYGQGSSGQPSYGQPAGQPVYGQVYGAGYGPGQYPAAYGQPPAPYSYGYGYAGTTGGTNGLATASLVTGIGGVLFGLAAPVAIGLGIAALVQIKRRHEGGKGMAIAGLVIGSVVSLGYVLLFGFLFTLGSTADDYGAPEPGSTYSGSGTYVDDLAVGECYDDGSQDGQAIRQPCSTPHDGEIIASVTLSEGTYPGDRKVDKLGNSGCSTEFGKYVGKSADDSELDLAWWTPTRALWNSGDRMVVCAAYGPNGDKLTATVKDSKR